MRFIVKSRFLLSGALFALVSLGLANGAKAGEDELLSILNGKSESVAAPNREVAISPLHKLIAKPNAEQNMFFQFLGAGEREKALYQYQSAFGETSFAKSASGQALFALLLFQNGLQLTAVNSLLAIENPSAIAPELVKIWQEETPVNHAVWSLVSEKLWKPSWTEIFGARIAARVQSREIFTAADSDKLIELLRATPVDSAERAALEWQMVLLLAENGDAAKAAAALSHLMKAPNNIVGKDLMSLTAARMLFQNGYLDASIKYDKEIPKTSEYWFEAQEEAGWGYIRKGEPQNAMAITKTLLNPSFSMQVGPEPFFLDSLAELKVCDYSGVMATLNQFRDRFRPRAAAMLSVSTNPDTAETKNLIADLKAGTLKPTEPKAYLAKLPRYVARDEIVKTLITREKALQTEAKQAGDIYVRSSSGGTAQVGFQAPFEIMRKQIEGSVALVHSAVLSRVKTLASDEVDEIAAILQKLRIVDVELVQRLSLTDRMIKATANGPVSEKKGTTVADAGDKLRFPAEKEVWFDELSNYKVDIKKDCQASGSSTKRGF